MADYRQLIEHECIKRAQQQGKRGEKDSKKNDGCKEEGEREGGSSNKVITANSNEISSLSLSIQKNCNDIMKSINGRQSNSATSLVEVYASSVQEVKIGEGLKDELERGIAKMSLSTLEKEQRIVSECEYSNLRKLLCVWFKCGQTRIIAPMAFIKECKGCGYATRLQIPIDFSLGYHNTQESGHDHRLASSESRKLFCNRPGMRCM